MPRLYGADLSRRDLCQLVGDMSQVAGVSRMEYAEGPERGVEVLRFRTGSGLDFDVLPGRGMDIANASYHGRPLAWMSANGIPHSAYYEPEGLGWLRGFFGGLLTTCGMLTAGGPSEDPEAAPMPAGAPTEVPGTVRLGLHGRVNQTPARGVSADGYWDGDDYLLCAQGRVRESIIFGENVELLRRIQATAGEPTIRIVDEVTNRGHQTMPHMMLYHMNIGWPVVAPASRVVVSAGGTEPRDAVAAAGLAACRGFERPSTEFPEQVFYHQAEPDARGLCQVGIINPALDGGLGVGITYRAAELDQLVQWKSMAAGTYVCGLEPANCRVGGRADERAAGRLKFIEPGQTITYVLTIAVLDGEAACAAFALSAER
ncbi:MAG: aldose 1-epimerase family protein [Armatimonadetes bacterium]|nr:aldose 1-epimerase family protein [Armatimonadota bacterium]